MPVRIAIGCDHRGVELKEFVIELLPKAGYSYEDFGTYTSDPVDYPDIAKKVAAAVTSGQFDYGILICGTGIGMCIVANKVRGIRAALTYNVFSAHRAREHINANILCLAAEEGKAQVPAMLEAFLDTKFEGGRHQRRIDKISDMEKGA